MKHLAKYFEELEANIITQVQPNTNMCKDLETLLDFKMSDDTTCLALKFDYEDSENLFFCLCPYGKKSLTRMIFECSQTDPNIRHYLLDSIKIAGKILLFFTNDKIDKS